MIGDAIRSSRASTSRLTRTIHSFYDRSDMENIDPLPMNCSSTVQVDAVSFPTDSRISVNTATAEDEDISISSPPSRKRQLDPKDSDEVKRRKTRPVRSSNANANADYESEDSDDEIVDDNIPATPSSNEKTSIISSRRNNYLLGDLHLQHSRLERRFLQPLLVAIQRQSEILKDVVDKQKKIIRCLRRRHVSDQISLVLNEF